MAFNIFKKFIQTVQLEMSKEDHLSLVKLLEKAKVKKPMLISEIKIKDKNGEIEVFNKSNMKLLRLTKKCKDILNMCNGLNAVEEISQKIYQKKILKRKFLEDLVLFLNELEKEGFITWK